MPRNISFMLTTEQFKNRSKTVTRRMKWLNLKAGDILMGCKKCMGLKPGEKVEKLGLIKIINVNRCQLNAIVHFPSDCAREGFPELTPSEFIMMFCREMKCKPSDDVTRIEFEYL